ncbi:MAG: hypothetical protein ACOYYU_08115 [Chloroflexota bacterium]
MPTEDLTDWIVELLADGHSTDDIILTLCERNDLSWSEAQAMVETIQAENRAAITRKQSPLLVMLALSTFLGGSGILAYLTFLFYALLSEYNGASPPSLPPLGYYLLRYGDILASLGPLAIAMLMGSMLGMRSVWEAFLFPGKD